MGDEPVCQISTAARDVRRHKRNSRSIQLLPHTAAVWNGSYLKLKKLQHLRAHLKNLIYPREWGRPLRLFDDDFRTQRELPYRQTEFAHKGQRFANSFLLNPTLYVFDVLLQWYLPTIGYIQRNFLAHHYGLSHTRFKELSYSLVWLAIPNILTSYRNDISNLQNT